MFINGYFQIMLYVALPSSLKCTKVVSATEIQTENGKKIKVTAHGPADSSKFVKTFVSQTKNSKDKAVVVATTQDLEIIIAPILENLGKGSIRFKKINKVTFN